MKTEINEDILRTLLQALESVNNDGKSNNKLSITVVGKPDKKLLENKDDMLEDEVMDESSDQDSESGVDMAEEDYGDMLPAMIEKMKAFKKKVVK